MSRNDDGLTLIELLVTLAVIAIVFAVAVPTFNGVLATASTNADTASNAIAARFTADWTQAGYTVINGTAYDPDGNTLATLTAPEAQTIYTYTAGLNDPTKDLDYYSGFPAGTNPSAGQFTFIPATGSTILSHLTSGTTYTIYIHTGPGPLVTYQATAEISTIAGTTYVGFAPINGTLDPSQLAIEAPDDLYGYTELGLNTAAHDIDLYLTTY